MKKVIRKIQPFVERSLMPGRATVLLGPRRVGKTTLIKDIIGRRNKEEVLFFNCDDPDVRERFTDIGLNALTRLLSRGETIVFDEAQRIKNIGILLKMIVDEMPDKRLLVSGSSSLDLSNEISEPLTGRKKTFILYPISVLELFEQEHRDPIATDSYLDDLLRFGNYPHTLYLPESKDKEDYVLELTGDYLYKDALEYQQIRNPEQLRKLLIALALQIGNEVSYTELGSLVGIEQKTVVRYCDLLEKSFVIFRLPALSRNPRTEISKTRKIFFYDIGIRNALIKNFNSYDLRIDRGGVWENFIITERMKRNAYHEQKKNYYFWRTYSQKEIDFIEESHGHMAAFEIKWSQTTQSGKSQFLKTYPGSSVELISRDSYLDFIV